MGLDLLQQSCGGRGSIEIGPHQQACARGGCKGNGYRELRVIAPADTRVRLGPCEIKHELAVGMGLDEGRRRGGQSVGVRERDVSRVPAGAGTDAVRVLERRKKLVSQERIAISPERVPLPRVELIDAVMDLRTWRRLRQECFSMSRLSR